MWNSFPTDAHVSFSVETITYPGGGGDQVHAYVVRPEQEGPRPGVVVVHHMPGWDEFYQEFAERLGRHGYTVICPDLYCRFGHGTPDDVAAKVRVAGGVADDSVVGRLRGRPGLAEVASRAPTARSASSAPAPAAATPCWWRPRVPGIRRRRRPVGRGVIMADDQLTPSPPVAPIDYTEQLDAPLLGLFGNDDQSPTADRSMPTKRS